MRVTPTLLAVAVVLASAYAKPDKLQRAQVRLDIDGDDDGDSGRGGSYAGLGSPQRGTFSAFGIGRGSYGDRVVSTAITDSGSFEGGNSVGDSFEGGRRARVYPSSLGHGLSRGEELQGTRILGSNSDESSSEGVKLARALFGQGSYGGGGQLGAGIVGSGSEEGSSEGYRLARILGGRGSSEEGGLRRAGRKFNRVIFGDGSSSESESSESESSESESSEESRHRGSIKIERLVGGRVGGGSSEESSFYGGRLGSGSSEGFKGKNVAVSVEIVFEQDHVPVANYRKDSQEVIKVVSAPVNNRRGGYY